MKIVLYLVLVVVFNTTSNAQSDSSLQSFERSFMVKFNLPADTCLNMVLLLKINVAENYKVVIDKFSDNAPESFQEALNKVRSTIDKRGLEAYLRKRGKKKTQVFVPIFFLGAGFPCGSDMLSLSKMNQQLFQFNKMNISGTCFFTEPLTTTTWLIQE